MHFLLLKIILLPLHSKIKGRYTKMLNINKIGVVKGLKLVLTLACLSFFPAANAQEHEAVHSEETTVEKTEAQEAEKPFDPQTVIFEHIGDSHVWHLWGEHEKAVAIPLPVILYIKGHGLEVFMSSAFHHGMHDVHGKYGVYRNEHEHIKMVNEAGMVDEAASEAILDFSITKNVASMFLSVIIVLLIFSSVAKGYKKNHGKAPSGIQSFFEPLIIFIRDEVAVPNIGDKANRYMPYLLTIFFFILINNLLGLLPAGANLTGNIAVTLVLAFITLLVTNFSANKSYWGHIFWPPVPLWLKPIMIPVEIVGILSKPFALMIRLFANITAGHIIVISLISLIFIFKSLAIAPVSVAFVLFMDVLELLVAFLQAFIFTMLTALFIGSAMVEHNHDHEHLEEEVTI